MSAGEPDKPDRGGWADPPGVSDGPHAMAVVADAVSRVLGVDRSIVRPDTPLASLGWDSLARVCWEDAVTESGWSSRGAASAVTVGDLAGTCVRPGASS
ncbi:MAG: acyl carrier protein [Candidatus Nanopelagicales bacterium]|jgi:hypothetical protein